ncbi:Uncharacterised protein [Vibrio cholerae]|nr:Uncharacterised protein [Vibrio cholerae]
MGMRLRAAHSFTFVLKSLHPNILSTELFDLFVPCLYHATNLMHG